MTYNRPPWPQDLYKQFDLVAKDLGYLKKGQRWTLLRFLLDYAIQNPVIFRKR